jgi:hypothetical protein
MRDILNPALLGGLFLTSLLACSSKSDSGNAKYAKQGQVCSDLGKRRVAEMMEKGYRDYTNLEVSDFYSPVLDACIHTEVKVVGVSFRIEDVSNTFIRERISGAIMSCDPNGANSAIIDSVNAYGGYVGNVRYDKWLDDGYGSLPATLRTPETPWTHERLEPEGLVKGHGGVKGRCYTSRDGSQTTAM